MSEKQLTILVPIYNEEDCIPLFYKKMDAFLANTALSCQVLLINDGSADNSVSLIIDKCRSDAMYNYIDLDKNYGLSTAIKAGFDTCTTPYLAYIDSDPQTAPEDLELLFSKMPEFDMSNGIRTKRKDTLVKKCSSKMANFIRRKVVKDNISDSCCPLKVIKTKTAQSLPFFDGMHRFIPALVKLKGGTVAQVPVRHYPRIAGTAKYHLFNRLVGPFFDMIAFYWMRKRNITYSINPSKLT